MLGFRLGGLPLSRLVSALSFTIQHSYMIAMPGPVVNGVRKDGLPALDQAISAKEVLPFLPLLNEGTIKLILLSSGSVLMARLRNTMEPDREQAYQSIHPLRVIQATSDDS